jgi:hypothetical protein
LKYFLYHARAYIGYMPDETSIIIEVVPVGRHVIRLTFLIPCYFILSFALTGKDLMYCPFRYAYFLNLGNVPFYAANYAEAM